MNRVTDKQLQYLVDHLNEVTGSPKEPWGKDKSGTLRANVGNYHLSHQYGGVHRMMNEGGGVNCPIQHYHGPKRELYDKLSAYLDGFDFAMQLKTTRRRKS